MPGGSLGCGTHTGIVVDRETGNKVLQISNPLRTTWSRVLNSQSAASQTVSTGTCCETLDQIRPWRHELVVYRNGMDVWQGPIIDVDTDSEESEATINALDRWAWFNVWWLRRDVSFAGDYSTIAEQIIREGMTYHGSSGGRSFVLDDASVEPSGFNGEFEYERYEETVGSALRALTSGPVNVYFVGTRLMITGPEPASRTAMLQDSDFITGFRVVRDGTLAATRVIVLGDDDVIAAAGGVDPYYGLIERVISNDAIVDRHTAQITANAELSAATPTPVVISPGNDAVLSQEAPVTIQELVPTTLIPVWTTATCISANEDMVLEELTVEETSDGEEVSIQMVSVREYRQQIDEVQ